MRVALFSPLPPVKSGIADYSAALLVELSRLAQVATFTARPAKFNSADFDAILYQIGNNPHHDFCYEMALQYPGVVVIHEGNLHHLIADLTIRRGDWGAYLHEVEYNGTPADMIYAQRVRALEVGPDYEGVPMLRRLLESARGAIVHSDFVASELRAAGYKGPIARIPHGAWIPEADRMGFRHKLGLTETTPLIGIFGFLKPYKRVAESLRAFRRMLPLEPDAKMILVGEPHPEFPLESLIESLGLSSSVRLLGFTPIDDFEGYIAACDIVLNLRFPTVGENSGTLMRALGMGKATIVSDIGSFSEYPDSVCLKAPVDIAEEDTLFEYLALLVSRPDLREQLGNRAREWVKRECNWPRVASLYLEFLEKGELKATPSPPPQTATAPPVDPAYIESWAEDAGAKEYAATHLTRLAKTLAVTPLGGPGDRVLEMGSYLQITPALKTRLNYGEVRGCYYGPLGQTDRRVVTSTEGETFECTLELFNAEKDSFPYADEYFATVLCCELIEHLFTDPMHMMSEIHRILKPGGHVVLTTPNLGSLRAVSAILQGYHPGFFPAYIRPSAAGEVDARHNREYVPREIESLLRDSGFAVTLLETGPFLEEPKPEQNWVLHLLRRYILPAELRGDGIYAVGRKEGPVRNRYPTWLYN